MLNLVEICVDIQCGYVKRMIKICKFERKFDCFTPYLRIGKGAHKNSFSLAIVA